MSGYSQAWAVLTGAVLTDAVLTVAVLALWTVKINVILPTTEQLLIYFQHQNYLKN